MKCIRCGGMMNYEKVYCDTEQSWGWSCISCGEYFDDVILDNREWQKTIQKNKPQTRGGSIQRLRYSIGIPIDVS